MAGKSTDPDRRTALAQAWGWDERRRSGPRPSLKLEDIVRATVALADADGIEAVSMKRVAEHVGLTTMALYRYVGSKDDLLFLAVDAAGGPPPPPAEPGEAWRASVQRWARAQLGVLSAHPWIARVPISEPPLGPHQVAWMERLLEYLAGSGLSPVDQLGVLNLLAGYVAGHFRLYAELTAGAEQRGITREEVERSYIEAIGRVIHTDRFPRVTAAFRAASQGPSSDASEDFEFGLARILDGVEIMANASAGGSSIPLDRSDRLRHDR